MTKIVALVSILAVLVACSPGVDDISDITARPEPPSGSIAPGAHPLGLGGYRIVNGLPTWRDGLLYIPTAATSNKHMPLLIWLHGGGGAAESYRYVFPIAEELGVVFLALDARHNTWDGIDSPFGPDVLFLNKAMQYIFEHVPIDPSRMALGGLSDGGSYALALGRTNGTVFSHLAAVAPGFLKPPAPPTGQPQIFIAHGLKDTVYNFRVTRGLIVPRLQESGYDVTYIEFDGPHWMTKPVAQQILAWVAGR